MSSQISLQISTWRLRVQSLLPVSVVMKKAGDFGGRMRTVCNFKILGKLSIMKKKAFEEGQRVQLVKYCELSHQHEYSSL